jgi:hypothetical protein
MFGDMFRGLPVLHTEFDETPHGVPVRVRESAGGGQVRHYRAPVACGFCGIDRIRVETRPVGFGQSRI